MPRTTIDEMEIRKIVQQEIKSCFEEITTNQKKQGDTPAASRPTFKRRESCHRIKKPGTDLGLRHLKAIRLLCCLPRSRKYFSVKWSQHIQGVLGITSNGPVTIWRCGFCFHKHSPEFRALVQMRLWRRGIHPQPAHFWHTRLEYDWPCVWP